MSDGGNLRRQHRWTQAPEGLTMDPRVSDRAFRLWCRLDRFAGQNGAAFPTRETLAVELRTSKESVDRAVKGLIEAGWLLVERHAGYQNSYVLVDTPEVDLETIIADSRAARIDATQPRRDRANAVKSDGGVVTSDEGLQNGHNGVGVVMGDEGGVVMGDDHKEATVEGTNTTTLLSVVADAPPDEGKKEHALNNQPDVWALCDRLSKWIVHNGSKPPTVNKQWRDAARLLLNADGKDYGEVERLIDWCQQDAFWQGNILSMPTFRKQYDRLRLKAQQEARSKSGGMDWDRIMAEAKAKDKALGWDKPKELGW